MTNHDKLQVFNIFVIKINENGTTAGKACLNLERVVFNDSCGTFVCSTK